MPPGVSSVNDPSCPDRIADIQHFHIFPSETFLDCRKDRGIGFHTKTDETVIKGKFLFFSVIFYQE